MTKDLPKPHLLNLFRDETKKALRPLLKWVRKNLLFQRLNRKSLTGKGKQNESLNGDFQDHREAAVSLKIKLGPKDLLMFWTPFKLHAKGGSRGSRDEIHAYCLDRLFEELVEEPSNILFTTKTGPDTMRYDAMNAEFWIECLDLMEATFGSSKDS